MVLALFQKLRPFATSILGAIGPKFWKWSTLLLIVAFIIMLVGQIGAKMVWGSNLRFRPHASSLFPRPLRDRGLLPRNRLSTSGASKTAGTTLAPVPDEVGSVDSSHSATNHSTNHSARKGRKRARSRPSIFRRHRIESPVTSQGSSSGVTQDYCEHCERLVPVV